jgi:polar amino acid transport system substrate-binding protein
MKYLLLTLLLGATLAPHSQAAERLAVGTKFSKIFEQDADGQWQGLGVDVLRILAARAGDTVRFTIYPWPRAQAMVERAQADILVGPYKSPERLKQFAFIDQPFYRDLLVFYARRDDDQPWHGDLAQLKSRRIAAVRGWHYGPQFDLARRSLDVSEVPQLENGAQMLAYGRVDLLASNERNSAAVMGALKLDEQLVVLCPAITQLDGYLAFPRGPKFSALRDRYNALFAQMVKSGELARLGAKNGVLVPAADTDNHTDASTRSARLSAQCTGKHEQGRPQR